MTTPYEVVARLEALEMGMNTAQTERLLASLNQIAECLAQLGSTVRSDPRGIAGRRRAFGERGRAMSVPPPAPPRRPEEKRFGPRQIDLPIAKIIALHKAGMSRAVLAKRFGVAHQ